jgi:hypothetical protein
MDVSRSNVSPSANARPAPAAAIDLASQLDVGRQYLFGDNGRIRCEWHGRLFGPLAEFALAVGQPQKKTAGAYEVSLADQVVMIEPRLVEPARAAVGSS